MCQEACNQTGQSDSKVGILHGRGSMGLKARQLFWVKVDEDSSRSIYNMLQWNVGKHIYLKNVHIYSWIRVDKRCIIHTRSNRQNAEWNMFPGLHPRNQSSRMQSVPEAMQARILFSHRSSVIRRSKQPSWNCLTTESQTRLHYSPQKRPSMLNPEEPP